MIPPERTAAVLLCAGLSRRFGEGNKLLAPLAGKPLLGHAADLLRSMPYAQKIAVVGNDADVEQLLDGFTIVRNPAPEAGQDGSVRTGIEAALSGGADAVMICLGDMPFVTKEHLLNLCESADQDRAATSTADDWRSPPLLLPRTIARRVLDMPKSEVRAVIGIADPAKVKAAPGMLRDFDTAEDFPISRSP